MKIAPRDVAGLIKAPGTQYSAFLLYGPDQGLVRERARQLAHHFCDQPDDPLPRPASPASKYLKIKPVWQMKPMQ